MKKYVAVLAAVLAIVACGSNTEVTYTNPVLHMDYSDPDAVRVGEDYWMTASSFNCFPGLPILHSKDLVHWELVGAALTDYPSDGSADDFRTTVHHGKAVWAPAIRYHDGWFYIFVGDPDRGIFMVRTQDPAGEWEKPVWVVREKGFIDPCPLWDSDGRAWLSHGLAGSRAGLKSVLFVAPMSPDGTRLEGPSRIVYDGHMTQPTIEGTKFYKRDGWYYIFSPAGGVATGWQTVLRSKDPYGPWEERIVMAWAPGTINGPHQGAWVDAPDGSSWFLHFQDKGAYGRIVHLQPMQWLADGWPLIGEDPDGDGVGQPVSGGMVPSVIAGSDPSVIAGCDRQSPIGLPLAWQYPAIPGPYWHMALPDGVRLYSVEQKWPYTSLWDCPNVLQQKFPAEYFQVTARLSFQPNPQLKERGETAGFVVMGNDYAGLRITDTADGAALSYIECIGASKGASETASQLCVLPYTAHPQPHQYESRNVPLVSYPDRQEATLWVKLEVAPKSVEGNVPDAICRFSYSPDGDNWTQAGSPFTAAPELWIGAKWGFFHNRFSPKNDAGWLDITQLKVIASNAQEPVDTYRITSLASRQCARLETELTDTTMPRNFQDGKVNTSNLRWWCSGFYPGTLWYTYKLGGDTKELALRQTAKMMDVEKLNPDHDIGFQVMSSVAMAYKETGDSLYLPVIRRAAEKLAARFSDVTGTIKSWDWDTYPVIIDNMMNLELLTYASRLFNEPRWNDIAITHARTTAKNHFRKDYSCYHLVDYNSKDGSILKKQTVQGYSDDSAWARGQAWALYGYTMMYRETGLEEFISQAEHIAAFLMPKLKGRPVPNWDYDAPEQQDDASAAAIMASAFLELATLSGNGMYRTQAEEILRVLCTENYLCREGECGGFILKHSTGHYPAGSEVDVPISYADYYFMEALWRYN